MAAATAAAPVCDTVGKHCILELYGCDSSRLDDEAFLRDTITTAAKRAGATLLNLITHRFEPQGVTGLALLAESHISIHTWPEKGTLLLDIFTCGPEEKGFNALAALERLYQPAKIRRQVLRRGHAEPDEAPFHPG